MCPCVDVFDFTLTLRSIIMYCNIMAVVVVVVSSISPTTGFSVFPHYSVCMCFDFLAIWFEVVTADDCDRLREHRKR